MKNESYLRELAMPLLGKWSIFIILSLDKNELYFAELERELQTISRKVLSQNLNDLISVNIIYKKGEASTGYKTFYGLTDLGKSLIPLIYQIKNWIKENSEELAKNK